MPESTIWWHTHTPYPSRIYWCTHIPTTHTHTCTHVPQTQHSTAVWSFPLWAMLFQPAKYRLPSTAEYGSWYRTQCCSANNEMAEEMLTKYMSKNPQNGSLSTPLPEVQRPPWQFLLVHSMLNMQLLEQLQWLTYIQLVDGYYGNRTSVTTQLSHKHKLGDVPQDAGLVLQVNQQEWNRQTVSMSYKKLDV